MCTRVDTRGRTLTWPAVSHNRGRGEHTSWAVAQGVGEGRRLEGMLGGECGCPLPPGTLGRMLTTPLSLPRNGAFITLSPQSD